LAAAATLHPSPPSESTSKTARLIQHG
jgi:hypothetical protein